MLNAANWKNTVQDLICSRFGGLYKLQVVRQGLTPAAGKEQLE